MCPNNSDDKLQVWHKGIAAALVTGPGTESAEPPPASNTEESPSSFSPKHQELSRESEKKAQNEAQRRLDYLKKLVGRRDDDQMNIRERRDRARAMREQRFERLLDVVLSGDQVTCSVSDTIRKYDDQMMKKKSATYHTWNSQVFNRLQSQIDSHLNPFDRCSSQQLSGSKTVGFHLPGQTFKPSVEPVCDPMKQDLYDTTGEVGFRRAFSEVDLDVKDPQWPNRTGQPSGKGWRTRHDLARSRPVLEPTEWGQLTFQSTPYAHFAQMIEHGGCSRTALKMDNFVLSEQDGVPAAGKRRTRWERNNLGVLQGNAVRGEAHKHFTAQGASSGAPTQDHYQYERGTRVTDTEFPLGKRIFPWKH